ncbi:MAG: methyltransferase domain-containing protein [Magnetococcales bacterium]|nr:methyltransferase domain-containing protein [Magnetococcales bacterium]
MQPIVSNYEIVADIPAGDATFIGDSSAEKSLIFSIFEDQAPEIQVLDIGFGRGTLGELIKSNPGTRHWQVDGIDGYAVTCRNVELFKKGYYRNIWHGQAQEMTQARMQGYDVLCLLDVIEHLTSDEAKALLRRLLASLRAGAYLFISTPLWFYPQGQQQAGDLEAHRIGVPAASMMALLPRMYTISRSFVGNFVYDRQSLDYVDHFHPVADPAFSLEQGVNVALAVGMAVTPGVVQRMPEPVRLAR